MESLLVVYEQVRTQFGREIHVVSHDAVSSGAKDRAVMRLPPSPTSTKSSFHTPALL